MNGVAEYIQGAGQQGPLDSDHVEPVGAALLSTFTFLLGAGLMEATGVLLVSAFTLPAFMVMLAEGEGSCTIGLPLMEAVELGMGSTGL